MKNGFKELVELMRIEANQRMYFKAPEDAEVLELCLKHGFGAVMDSAARQWQQRDKTGAFVVGPCRGSVEILFNPKSQKKKKK